MGRLENILGKGKTADNKQFLLFPHCFISYLDVLYADSFNM